jgi:hypothetical protein
LAVTGAVVTIVVVAVGSAEAVAPPWGAVFADPVVLFALVWGTAFVGAVAAPVVVVAVASAPAGAAAVADWRPAMAAAAIASGAVPLADPAVVAAGVGVGVGVTVTATVTGMATATGVVAAVLVPSCDAGSAGPFVEAEVEASVDDAAVDVVESPFAAEGLVRERGGASVLLLALAPEVGPLLAS